jgi:hypothetical protein
MTSGAWYCRFDGEESGPFSVDELEYLVRRAQLTRKTEMRREGSEQWIPAEDEPGLFPHRSADPPQPRKPVGTAETRTNTSPPPAAAAPAINPPEIPEVAPPPIPKNGSPISRGILAGVAALLALLLLATLFWHGDGGRGSAKGSGGNAAGGAAGRGSKGEGNAGDGNGGGEAASHGQGGNAKASKDAGGGSDSNQGREDASASQSTDGSDPASEKPDSQEGRRPESPEEGQEEQNSPSTEGRSAAEKDRKPIPKMVNAVVFDGDKPESAPDETEEEGEEAGDADGASGGPGSAGTFFGITAKGRKFVYIVDRSGSMAGGRFARAREELIRSVKDLTEKQSFYVLFFSDGALPMFDPPENTMCRATRENLQRLETWVHSVPSGGGTDPTDALLQALKMEPDAIFLLSDGDIPGPITQMLRQSNTRFTPPSSKSKRTRTGRTAIVTINTIGFENTAGEPLLKQIAAENDGEYRFIPGWGFPFP